MISNLLKGIKEYLHNRPRVEKAVGVILIIIGLAAFITPLTPGSWLVIIGLELLGVRILLSDKLKFWKREIPLAVKPATHMAQNKKLMKNTLIALVLLVVAGFLAYSLIQYKKSGIAKDGIVSCVNEQCFWSAHIHVDVPIQMCGEKYVLPKFKGPLTDDHTHGDENIIHWHDKIAFDADKKRFLGPNPFALNLVFKTLGLPITDEDLLGKKDGDLCRGIASTWKVMVNGALDPNWRTYAWKDHDIVLFVFDARTAEEIEKELRKNPLKFSPLGEG